MSIWTQINGCIRIDGIPSLDVAIEEHVIDVMGKTCDFESPESVWDACTVPCGSEGSLQYNILTVGTGLVLYTVPIWGDLRDYDNEEEIRDWFNRIVNESGLMIRSAILEYRIGQADAQIMGYTPDD